MAFASKGKRLGAASLVSATLLCASCASVPPVCPRIPSPPADAMEPPAENSLDLMRSFLRGTLPTEPKKPDDFAPARPGSKL